VIRALSTAGVRLAFSAATRRLDAEIEYGRACRQLFKLDVAVDGGEPRAFGPDSAAAAWAGTLFEGGRLVRRRFEIWLPHCAELGIRRLTLDDGAGPEALPAPAGGAWLALGDSITQGMTATRPALTWAARVARELDLDLINLGVGGAKYDARVGPAAGAISARLATVAFGANDSFQQADPAEVERQAAGLIAGLRARGPELRIAVITPVPCFETDGAPASGQLDPYRAAARRAAAGREHVWVLEGPELMPAEPGLFIDGVHPNDAGMAAYARNLVPRLREILET
jgi:lysophospholipase L1-like esterase